MAARTEKMTAVEIRDWIDTVMMQRSWTWFLNRSAVDAKAWEEHAEKTVPHSDLNAAREVYAAFKDKIHYIPGLNAWHVWNGVFHEKIDGDLLATWMCTAFVDTHKAAVLRIKNHIHAEADQLVGDQRDNKLKTYYLPTGMFKPHRSYREKIHDSSGLTGLTKQIKNIFSVEDNFFSDDRRWLVMLNGVLDLYDLRDNPVRPGDLATLQGRLLEHDSSRPVYRAVNAHLDPYADSLRWRGFLETSLPDPELRKFLAVVTGAAFLAESKTKIIPVLKGPRDSGKTVFVDTVDTLADGYGGQPDTSAINKSSGPNFEQDAFRGLRFVGISEPNVDRKVDDSFLKKFTGGDVLSTRNLHQRSVEWKSQGILFVATNQDLKFNTADTAILTRLATVTFPNQFYQLGQIPKGKEDFVRDAMLERDLMEELDGVLSWILNGLLVYLDEGIVIPTAVQQDRERQYIEGNTVHLWIEESVKRGNEIFILEEEWDHSRSFKDFVAVSEAHLAYTSWVSTEVGADVRLFNPREFTKAVCNYLGVDTQKSGLMRIPRLVYKDRVGSIDP